MPNRWFILSLLFFARFCMAGHYVLIAAVLPLLVAELGLSYAQAGLLIGLFMFPGIVFALPGGYLGLWIGDKRLTVLGLALITLGGGLFALADSFWTAAGARVLSGVGASVLNVILYKMATDWFQGREVSTAVALVATSWPLGIGVALVTLGAIATALSWQAAALAVAGLSLAGLLAVARFYRDPPGAARAQRGAGGLQLGISGRELVTANLAGAARMVHAVGQGTFISFAPTFLVAQGTSVTQAGFLVSLVSWLMLGSTPLGGFLADRLRRPLTVIVAGSAVTGVMMAALPHVALPAVVLLLMGLSAGLPAGPVNALPGQALRPESRNVGFGIFFTWTYAGHSALPPLAGWLVDVTGEQAMTVYFTATLVLLTLPVLALFRLSRPRTRPRGRGGAG